MSEITRLRLGPELLIYQVSELKAELDRALQGLADGAAFALDAQDLADVDGAGLQLLALLHAELLSRGSRLEWHGLSRELAASIEASGMAQATAAIPLPRPAATQPEEVAV